MAGHLRHSPVSVPQIDRTLATFAWALALAAAMEFLLLRNMSRTALHIPDVEDAQALYTVGSNTGRYAFFVAIAALAGCLGALARMAFSTRDARAGCVFVALGAFTGAAVLAATDAPRPLSIGLGLSAVVVASALAVTNSPRLAPLVALIGLAFTASSTWHIAHGTNVTNGPALAWIIEIATIAAAFALPLALRVRFTIADVTAGTVVGILFLGYVSSSPSTAGILLLWNGGLAGLLPAPIYSLALAVLIATGVALGRCGRAHVLPAAVLFVCASLTLQNSYQTGLLVVALLLLAVLPVEGPQRVRVASIDAPMGHRTPSTMMARHEV